MREYECLLKKILDTCDYNNLYHRVRAYEYQGNEKITFEELVKLGLIKNVTHIGLRSIGFDLTEEALYHFEKKEEVLKTERDYTYKIPDDFEKRVIQILSQEGDIYDATLAFRRCKYEYEDVGFAYYAGISGDNWNKKALDFTFEGLQEDISILKSSKSLFNSISKALRSSTSGLVLRDLAFLAEDTTFVPLSNQERLNADITSANLVLNDLIKISEKLCSNATYDEYSSENSINDYYRDSLSFMGYREVKDQTRHGISSTGHDAGEVDILISKNDKEIAIFEGFKLNSVNRTYIDSHIEKAIGNYNALGTATFVVAYVSTNNFASFWSKYISHLKDYTSSMNVKKELSETVQIDASVKASEMIISREEFDFPVFFIAVKINK